MKKMFLLMLLMPATLVLFAQQAVKFTQLSGSGSPVIFLPHIGCSSEMWSNIAGHYQNDHAVYLADFAGFNGMDAIKAPYTAAYARGIRQFIKDNKLKNVVLVGQNYGAFVAFNVAQDTSLSITAIIASDFYPKLSMVISPDLTAGMLEQMKAGIRKGTIGMNTDTFALTQRTTAEMMNFSGTDDVDRFVNWQLASDRTTLAETLCEQLSTDLLPALANNKIPVFVFSTWYFAKKYRNMPLAEAPAKLKEMYGATPGVTHRITEVAKDFMANDQPQWFMHEMDNFLKQFFGK